MADQQVGSPLWWLDRLDARLKRDRKHMALMDRYYRGDHPLPEIPPGLHPRYHSEFRSLLESARANFMRLVVDATKERLRVQGFLLSASSDRAADEESWRIWQANQLDAESILAFREALVKRRSYFSVWPGQEYPTIAVEDPTQTIVEFQPGNRRKRAAALKAWTDDWAGEKRADVYIPGEVHRFFASGGAVPGRWRPMKAKPVIEHPFGVPILPMVNRPDIYGDGESEIADVIAIQDRINATVFNRMLAGWFTAFRQRWVTGIDIPIDPETGQQIEPFKTAIDRLWVSENPSAKFGEFEQTDLGPYLQSHERDVQDIAVITRTPRHYLFQQGQSPSGDAIKSAETGLVAKVKDKQEYLAEQLEEVIRLARRMAGEPDTPVDSKIDWVDPEYRSEGEQTDSVIKQWLAGRDNGGQGLITRQAALEKLGYTPTEIERMRSQRAQEAIEDTGADVASLFDEDVA